MRVVPVARAGVDLAGDRCRSAPSRLTHRPPCRAAYMVTELAASSAPALSRSCRRPGPRSLPLGRHKTRILSPRPRAQPHVPRQAARLPQAELRRNQLCFAGKLTELSTPYAFHSLLGGLRRREWVVYSKPPFGGPEHVLKYLARYTHRVAISNGRLLGVENGQVRFPWRDSRHNNRSSVMKLDAVEFIRRFLLHVLPAGFVKIRHFGLLANRNRHHALTLCRFVLGTTAPDITALLTEQQKSALSRSCPQCRCGT